VPSPSCVVAFYDLYNYCSFVLRQLFILAGTDRSENKNGIDDYFTCGLGFLKACGLDCWCSRLGCWLKQSAPHLLCINILTRHTLFNRQVPLRLFHGRATGVFFDTIFFFLFLQLSIAAKHRCSILQKMGQTLGAQ
jgi:hypothetical protein